MTYTILLLLTPVRKALSFLYGGFMSSRLWFIPFVHLAICGSTAMCVLERSGEARSFVPWHPHQKISGRTLVFEPTRRANLENLHPVAQTSYWYYIAAVREASIRLKRLPHGRPQDGRRSATPFEQSYLPVMARNTRAEHSRGRRNNLVLGAYCLDSCQGILRMSKMSPKRNPRNNEVSLEGLSVDCRCKRGS